MQKLMEVIIKLLGKNGQLKHIIKLLKVYSIFKAKILLSRQLLIKKLNYGIVKLESLLIHYNKIILKNNHNL